MDGTVKTDSRRFRGRVCSTRIGFNLSQYEVSVLETVSFSQEILFLRHDSSFLVRLGVKVAVKAMQKGKITDYESF